MTGAQIPHLAYPRNDSVQNLITALGYANPKASRIPVVPEVAVLFNGVLLRGNRTRKADATGFDAYESPNYPELGRAGQSLGVNTKAVKPMPSRQFKLNRRLDTNVQSIPVFPGIQDGNMLPTAMRTPGLKGAVIWGYGTGNIPTNADFLETIGKANAEGKVMSVVTQCRKGSIELGVYETSAELLELGMVTGFDMSPEAALCKLMVLLGDEDMDVEEVKYRFQSNIAGESSRSVYVYPLKGDGGNIGDGEKHKRMAPAALPFPASWSNDSIQSAVLRLYGAKVDVKDKAMPTSIDAWLDISSDDDPDKENVKFCGSYNRYPTDRELILTLPITDTARNIMTADGISASVRVRGNGGSLSWKKAEIAVFVDEDRALRN